MASIRFTTESDVRGSMGGITYSRNRSGAYRRARVSPVNPNTARQQAARSRFTFLTARWSSVLTDAQRTAWNQYADAVPVLNRLGDSIKLSGFNMFIRSNTQQLQVIPTVIVAGPTILTLPDIDTQFVPTVSEATQLISVAFDDTLAWVGEDGGFMQVSMMAPVGVGRSYLVGPGRYAGAILGDSTTPPTSPTTIAVPFIVAETQQVIVSARIGRADGRLSSQFQDSISIAA